ncbi:MAG TPA: hypothetical protein DIW64_02725 [Cellvibrio sp.]|nr:hypothetical protein [Cellvibrio sp.]
MFNFKTLLKGKKSVQIEFSEDEYKKLIELVFVGEWVLTHDVEVNNPYDPIRNKIYYYAHEMGLSKCITHNPELGGYFETDKFEKSLLKKINSFARSSQGDE